MKETQREKDAAPTDDEIVAVVDDAVAETLARSSGRPLAQVQDYLEVSGRRALTCLSHLASEAGLASDQVMRHGIPYREIVDLAQAQAMDLIVRGRVGSRGLRRILIGRVPERVIEFAPCPVLVV